MKVKSRTLLLIASLVWVIAGFNIVRIGFEAYRDNLTMLNVFLSIVVFCLFWFLIFSKLVIKHTNRIKGYGDKKQLFIMFFDLKSFMIMAFMMVFGILIRSFDLAPEFFIAFFYTGLGTALFLAGLLFGKNYLEYDKKLV